MDMAWYATKLAPLFAPSNAYRGLNVRAIVECYNAMSQEPITTDRLTVGKFIGLPSSVLAFYGDQWGKSGRDIVKKGHQLLSMNPINGKFGDIITEKSGFGNLILSGCWHTIKQVGFGQILVFPFGCAFDAADMSRQDMESAMKSAIDWLPIKPKIEIRDIRV